MKNKMIVQGTARRQGGNTQSVAKEEDERDASSRADWSLSESVDDLREGG